MKKTIYLSGSISDNETNEPREGWQQEFMDAEKRLHIMGYNTINPVDIARETEDEWRQMWQLPKGLEKWNGPIADAMLQQWPTRATYILACLQTMNTEALAGRLDGMYLLGSPDDRKAKGRLYSSHGVRMEMRMARVLGIPVFAEFHDGCEVDMNLRHLHGGLRLCEGGKFGKENWSDKL